METLIAEMKSKDNKRILTIYYENINESRYFHVVNENGGHLYSLCETFEKAVMYACEDLELIEYK